MGSFRLNMAGPAKFPSSPHWWQCCISFPDEPDKVLLGREGGLNFDYERDGRGRRHFRTVLQPELREPAHFISQDLQSARVPVATTTARGHGVEFISETLATIPDTQGAIAPLLVRSGGEERVTGWDGPKVRRVRRDFVQSEEVAPEFRDVAWGEDGAEIVYELRVEPGARRTAVLGFAEGVHKQAGNRILCVEVDGAEAKSIDPVQEFGEGRPGLLRMAAHDHNGDGVIEVKIKTTDKSPDRDAFLSALWFFSGDTPSDENILSGDAVPEAFGDCGRPALLRRRFLVRLSLVNSTAHAVERTPLLRIWTLERAALRGDVLEVGPFTKVRGRFARLLCEGDALLAELPPVTLAPGETAQIFLAIDRHGYEGPAPDNAMFCAAKEAAVDWWANAHLPYGVIEVPDRRIQELIDSSVRNIYQARDIKEDGLPAFHVGPTCYRQLWIVDGAFLLETAALLGRGSEARAGLAYILGYQEPDGGFRLKARYWKETGIVLWTVARHARLTNDRAWLRSVWPQVEKAADFIRRLRHLEDAGDPSSPIHRLAPYGDIDGGISNMGDDEKLPEFSNTYWLLTGLKAAAEAAEWLGETAAAREWMGEFEDMRRFFLAAAATNLRTDAHGNRYLPIRIGADDPPQKGQWAFCHAVHPGAVFQANDPFVRGMLAMLDAPQVEGLVFDTGWMKDGLWTYFSSFLGHAHLQTGNADAALACLEAMADHAAPVLVWREEQKPSGRGDEEVGDMPHNWASAEFIRLAGHLLAFERGDELHLFEGVPAHWLRDGAVTALHGAATAFGPVTASLRLDGDSISVDVAPLGRRCAAIVVHCSAWDPGAEPLRFDAAQGARVRRTLAAGKTKCSTSDARKKPLTCL